MTLTETFPAANDVPAPTADAPQGTQTPPPANVATLPTGQARAGAQTADQTTRRSKPKNDTSARPQLDSGQVIREPHLKHAAVIFSPPAIELAMPIPAARAGNLFDGYLCLVADAVDDLERTRIATENRVRALTRDTSDSDGEMRGLGLDARSPEVATAATLVRRLKCDSKVARAVLGKPPRATAGCCLEHDAVRSLTHALRSHPLNNWMKSTLGVGPKQGARLLAAIGDPYWNDLHDHPRTVSELWAYCGLAVHDGRAQRRMKGVKANWSNTAKMRAYVIAESIVKATIRKADDAPEGFTPASRVALTDYGQVYLDRRTATLDRLHATECVRCGPSGKPALPGSPWSGAHQQADALRVVSKAVLKGLWLAARDIHESETTR